MGVPVEGAGVTMPACTCLMPGCWSLQRLYNQELPARMLTAGGDALL